VLRKSSIFICLVLTLLIFSCTSKHSPVIKESKGITYGRPYVIHGKKYYPYTKIKSFQQVGIASWYGSEEHGKLTASGERFNMYALTAAHKLLPLGSYVHVKNLENGKEVIVKINDRGPFVSGRIIDLSYAAAKKIGIVEKGLAKVKITLLSENPDFYRFKGKKYDINNGNFAIQIGSFTMYSNAKRVADLYYNSKIVKVYLKGKTFYRVQLTGYHSLEKAERALKKLKYKYPGAFIVAND